MPITNGNYTTPQWQDNSPPPIDDSEMQAMSDTVEGNQIIVGSGAPPSVPKSPQLIPRYQSVSDLESHGYSVAYNEGTGYYFHVGSDGSHDVKVSVYDYGDYWIRILFTCEKSGAIAYCLKGPNETRTTSIMLGADQDYPGIYSNTLTFNWASATPHTPTTVYAPVYASYDDAMEAEQHPPAPYRIGQRYADMSTTPPTIYEVKEKAFDGQPIPKTQTREGLLADDRCRVATYDQYGTPNEVRFGSDDDHNLSVVTYYKGSQYPITFLISCQDSGAICYYLDSKNQQWVGEISISQYSQEYNLYTQEYSILDKYTFTSLVPYYQSLTSAMEACANQPAAWKQEADPNRNLAREYSTGGSYAAGDYCIRDGKLYKALEAVSGGAWDGTKWEEARLTDDLRAHEEDQDNPHEVTAAQTGAAAGSTIATVQTTNTAVRDYYAGEYFFYEGQLYELKEAVAQGGDLFASGTSETAVLGDGVTALRPKTGTITLSASWSGSDPYTQSVTVSGAAVTEKSKIDLIPTGAQLAQLAADDVKSVTICNNGGRLTAYAVGAQPSGSMTVACLVEETV